MTAEVKQVYQYDSPMIGVANARIAGRDKPVVPPCPPMPEGFEFKEGLSVIDRRVIALEWSRRWEREHLAAGFRRP